MLLHVGHADLQPGVCKKFAFSSQAILGKADRFESSLFSVIIAEIGTTPLFCACWRAHHFTFFAHSIS